MDRSESFGEVASLYERYRPGPPLEVVEWMLPARAERIVDLGAGTGALTRMLVDRAPEVVAVEPDPRMRAVLSREVPRARAVAGRGDAMPLPDAFADAVLASSSWHWMDPLPTLLEVGRVLVPGGVLGAVWSGPDPEAPFLTQARALLAERARDAGPGGDGGGGLDESEFATFVQGDGNRPPIGLTIPSGVPFDQPEHAVRIWDVPLNADDLIGMLGTFSWVILMPEVARLRLLSEARRLLSDLLGVKGDVTVDVSFKAEAWRSRRTS